MPTDQSPTTDNLTGIILAGGQGARMGGVDKGWVDYQGQPLIQHTIAALQPQVAALMISANRSLNQYQALGFPVVADQFPDFAGPLAGIHACAVANKTCEWIITMPVDSPHVEADYVSRMIHAQEHHHADIIVATDGDYPQPVFLLLRTRLATSLATALAKHQGKVMRWVRQHDFAWCSFDPAIFSNKNYLADL